MILGTISHPNPIIDRKVKHFYDHTRYLLSPNRDVASYPLENHLTFLERISYKMQNKILFPSTVKVIDRYLNYNHLFCTTKDFFSRKKPAETCLKFLKQAKSKRNIDEKFKIEIEKLIKWLNGNEGLGDNGYFQKILTELVKHLGSNDSIDRERNHIDYFTELLISEFLRVGFHREDIERTDGALNRILSKKVKDFDGAKNNTYSKFLLPAEIENERGKEGFRGKIEDFLERRTFEEQFNGLFNFYSKTKTAEFLFRIYNVDEHPSDFSFQYENVNIFHRELLDIKMETWEDYFIKKFEKFIIKEKTLIAVIPISYKSEFYAIREARLKIREAIDFLNYVGKDKKKDFNGAILDTRESYIVFEKGKSIRGLWGHDTFRVNNSKTRNYLNFIYPQGYINLDKEVQIVFKQCDKMLFRAQSSIYWDEKINFYWRFIEGIFGYGKEMEKGSDIAKKISKILLLNEHKTVKERLEYTITNAFGNSSRKKLNINIPAPHLLSLINNIHDSDDDSEFLKLEILSDYPFISEKFDEYKNGKINYTKADTFYRTLFLETFDQRNFSFHQNDFCLSTISKLITELPNLLSRLRMIILNDMISRNNSKVQECIQDLYEKGKELVESNTS